MHSIKTIAIIVIILMACLIVPAHGYIQLSVNNMTSNTAPSPFVVSASSESAGTPAWYAFNGNLDESDRWQTASVVTGNQYIQQYIPSNNLIATNYTIYSFTSYQTRNPKNWTLEASNSASGPWTILDTRSGQTTWSATYYNYSVTSPGGQSYTYYRLNITAVGEADPAYRVISGLIIWGEPLKVPVANFINTTPLSGNPPLSVTFSDTTIPEPTGWEYLIRNESSWGGNGTWIVASTSQNPTIVFPAGNWSVKLNATNSIGYNLSVTTLIVNATRPNNVAANFTVSNSTGIQPLLVQFTDTSTTTDATIDSWSWDFGDGNTSTSQSPDHLYEVPGTHTVNLTITNTSLSLVSTKLGSVTVYKVPVADFSSFNTQGTAPFTTYLYDTSTNLNAGPYTYYWDLGDGNTSTSQNLYYTWNITGTYDVKHCITDSVTTACNNKTAYVTVGTAVVAPVASFYGGPQLGAPPLKVFFTDVSTNTPTSWFWEFGDGTNSTSRNPEHYFNRSGFYTVNLTVANTAGSNMTTQKNFVMVY